MARLKLVTPAIGPASSSTRGDHSRACVCIAFSISDDSVKLVLGAGAQIDAVAEWPPQLHAQ